MLLNHWFLTLNLFFNFRMMLVRRRQTSSSPLLPTAQRKPAHTELQEDNSEVKVKTEDAGLLSHKDVY